MARQQARRRRRERAVGITVVLLGAAVLAVAIVALREPKGHVTGGSAGRTIVRTVDASPSSPSPSSPSRRSSSPATTSSSDSSSASQGVKSVPLVVLNASTVGGLARTAANRFEQGGWQVSDFDNLPTTITGIISTCAYYDPSVTDAQAAAEELQREYPTIKRVREKFDGLPAGPVVVVLTSDYSSG